MNISVARIFSKQDTHTSVKIYSHLRQPAGIVSLLVHLLVPLFPEFDCKLILYVSTSFWTICYLELKYYFLYIAYLSYLW
jgi:hypothetical protein